MSKSWNVKRFLAVLVAVLMLISVTACGGAKQPVDDQGSTPVKEEQPGQTQPDEPDAIANEPITLSIWSPSISLTGVQQNPIADEIAKNTGVTMDIINGDAQKFKLLLAGNDLPDIVQQNFTSMQIDANTLVSSGQLLELDSLIDQYGENLKNIFPKKLEYAKMFLSNNQNKIFFIPVLNYLSDPENPSINYMGASQATFLRWDIYGKVGYPEINNYDDLLNVLKQMQDAYPQTEDGKKVYAISGWSDWGIWPWHISNMYNLGCSDLQFSIWFDNINGKAIPWYTDDRFWESVGFYNKAHRMGLLDPEAFTMKYSNFADKCGAGQVLMCYASWQANGFNDALAAAGHPEQGFQYVMSGHPYVSGLYKQDAPVGFGADYPLGVSINCKAPERAVQFIDYLAGFEGSRLVWSGVEGTHWNMVDGKPVPTDEKINGPQNDADYNNKEGFLYTMLSGMEGAQIAPDGFPVDLSGTEEQMAKNLKEIDKQYIQHYGSQFKYPGQVVQDFVKQGKIKTWTKNWVFPQMVGEPSDDTKRIISTIDEYMKVQIAKIILAESDAQFNSEVQIAKDYIYARGYEEANAEILGLYEEAKKALGSFDPYN